MYMRTMGELDWTKYTPDKSSISNADYEQKKSSNDVLQNRIILQMFAYV